jgi:hypothetical protein
LTPNSNEPRLHHGARCYLISLASGPGHSSDELYDIN